MMMLWKGLEPAFNLITEAKYGNPKINFPEMILVQHIYDGKAPH